MEHPNEPTNTTNDSEHHHIAPMLSAESLPEPNSDDVDQARLNEEPSYTIVESTEHAIVKSTDDSSPMHELTTDVFLPPKFEFTPAVRPNYSLYSALSVASAGFWGGILGASLVLAINYWVLRRRVAATSVMLIGAMALLFFVRATDGFLDYWLAWSLVISVVTGAVARLLQGHLVRHHKTEGGELGSGLSSFGLGVLGSLMAAGLLGGVAGIESLPRSARENRIAFGQKGEIYYANGATRDEAQRLGEHLKNDKWFEGDTSQSVILAKSGTDFLISVFYEHGVWDDQELLKFYEGYASELSGDVFDGKPVQFFFRKASNGQIMHRLTAKTGVSRSELRKHLNAADLAIQSQNYAETERHYRAAVEESEKHESLRADLVRSLNNVGHYRLVQQFTDDVDTWFNRAVEIGNVACGPNSYEVGYALDGLGDWEVLRGNLSKAEEFYRRALSIRKTLGVDRRDDHHRTLESLINVLISQEKIVPAEVLQKHLVTLAEETSGVGSAQVASCMSRLGWLQCRAGKLAEAKETLTESLKMIEKLPQKNDYDHWMCLWRLGLISNVVGENVNAEKHLRRGIELLQDSDKASKLLKVSFSSLLADVLEKQARYDESEQLFRQVLEIREQELGLEHVDVADCLGHLGILASIRGQYAEAESQLKRAIDLFEKSAERDQQRERIADCLFGLALLYHTQGRYADAEPLYRKVITIREDVLGGDHYLVATALGGFSKLYSDQGDYVSAERLARQSHEILEKILGTTNPFLVRSLHRLALAQNGQRKLRDAEETLRRALEIGEKNPGSDQLQIAEVQNSLAAILLERARPKEAEPLLEQAIARYEAIHGPNHPSLSGPLNNLGLIYSDRGELLKGEKCLARSLKLAELQVGMDHPYLLFVLYNYESVLRQLNRNNDADEIERRRKEIQSKGVPREINVDSKPVVL